ncbi:hypothetical protein HID58_057710, partial [Brassica napus]
RFDGGSASTISMVVLLDGDGPLATLALLKSKGKRFLCIGGDGALSRWRRSLSSFSLIRCIGGDGALLDGDRALLDGDVGGVQRR